MMNTIIDLNPAKLTVSIRYQARKTPGQQPLPDLADSIAAQGLLQNIVVTKAKKRGAYEVVAGGRRLQAIQLLIADGRWPEDQQVPALLVAGDSALEASITENVQREAMHPADEFEAFAALIEQGKTIEDVAARFGVSTHVVKRRMRLASVAPELIAAYRAGEMALDALMAFAVSEDRERQRDVWAGLSEWERSHPHIIRSRLTVDELTANSGVTRYVGLDAYHAVGGRSFRDLFAYEEDGRSIYIQDRTLIERLALAKLDIEAEAIRAEGWGWVSVALDADNEQLRNYGRTFPESRPLTKAEKKSISELSAQRDAIEEKMDAVVDDDGTQWLELEQAFDDLEAQIENIQDGAQQWPPSILAAAGALVTIGSEGRTKVWRGLIRPEDRQDAAHAAKGEDGETGARVSLPQAKTRRVHSERLVRQLTANKVGIVAAELATKPTTALAVLVAQLARKTLISGYYGCGSFGIGISAQQEALEQYAPDFTESKAGQELARVRQHWLDLMPKDECGETDDLLQWALGQDTATLLDFLAYLVAASVRGVQHQESTSATPLDALAAIDGIDPSRWWEPSAESYLAHVSKDRIIEAVTEGADEAAAAPLAKMKKGEAVQAAQQALAGRGWLPDILRIRVE
ncbi:ParB/RepB/Spo0J family partition protein [Pusillimonas sp.]|uniref:ParB/RepB/Spo0J family partition protein n=1 Tax=Pusillimonas sp. TaxID=3040095 RepID=UPI0029A8C3EA|nr:ParB/RepB/Spo0J family partition protein [Pusillimonas sp.]MDX3893489.1 ParB/RepB/Spo0J family partition protein [Pusillimonas sp.]